MVGRSGTGNPFVGLRAFTVADAEMFFGRETQVEKLVARLRATRFLATVGASACGKSSLLLAGLVPALQQNWGPRARTSWRIAAMRPGAAPVHALATVLARTQVLGSQAEDPDLQRAAILQELQSGERGLADLVSRARLRAGENLLVIVDQFEDLFRYGADADPAEHASEAEAFVKLLLTAAASREHPIYVAITLRSDSIGDCARFGGLTEAVNDGVFLVPRLTREQMQRAIEQPLLRAGDPISPSLVERILDDVQADADQLAILEHALMRTWDAWSKDHTAGEPLALRHYDLIGGMRGALSKHADDLYNELDAKLKAIAERLFRCLTAKDSENRGVRRPTSFRTACAITAAEPGDIERLVRIFAAPDVSFLTASGPVSNPRTVLDISHESLMRLWDRLRAWVHDEAESAKTYRKLVHDATRKRPRWIDPELAIGEAWLDVNRAAINAAWGARYDDALAHLPADEATASPVARERFDTALAFLSASAAAPRRSVGLIIALVGVFVVVAAVLAVFGFALNNEAIAERHRAEELNKTTLASEHAKVAETRRLNAAAARLSTLSASQRALAMQLAKAEDERRRAAQHPTPAASPIASAAASPTAAPTAQASASPRPTVAPRSPRPAPSARPRNAVPAIANSASCSRAVEQQRIAADATISRQASYDAAVAGLADNAQCGDRAARVVNEGYLRSTLAAAEHELGVGDWRADFKRADELLARCQTMPELQATKAPADCLAQRRFNERAVAEF